jgi:hypothetical protein
MEIHSGAVHAAAEVMRAFPAPWCVAGGWALDLFLGRQTRAHTDVDLAIFRADQHALQRHLSAWKLLKVEDGRLSPWAAGERIDLPVHEIHAMRGHGEPGALEILLNERDGDRWVYRRDPAVTLPVARLILRGMGGVPALCPEVVLLYKCKAPRDVDEEDFQRMRPHLNGERRAWLAAALATSGPGHRWIAELLATADA